MKGTDDIFFLSVLLIVIAPLIIMPLIIIPPLISQAISDAENEHGKCKGIPESERPEKIDDFATYKYALTKE